MSAVHDIVERASMWLIRREESGWTDADQAELDAWLDQSMMHKAAYWRLRHGWSEADRVRALGYSGSEGALGYSDSEGAEGVQDPDPSEVGSDAAYPHPGEAATEGFSSARPLLAYWRPAALAASLVAAVAVWQVSGVPAGRELAAPVEQHYATQVGGHRSLGFADGSWVELNTATRVRTAITPERREVWLDKGEAYFQVAHAEGRPFVVHAGSRTITVLGTKFSVRRDGDKVTVSVVEGRVRVEDASANARAAPAAIITAGDVAVAQGPSTLLTAKSDERVENALSWRDGMLTFDQSTLGEAATEFNRYNARRLVVADADVATIRIGGAFPAKDVDGFARLLHDVYGLKVDRNSDEIKISN